MGLRDGRGGEWLLVERSEELFDPAAEARLDLLADDDERQARCVILQGLKRFDPFGREDVVVRGRSRPWQPVTADRLTGSCGPLPAKTVRGSARGLVQ